MNDREHGGHHPHRPRGRTRILLTMAGLLMTASIEVPRTTASPAAAAAWTDGSLIEAYEQLLAEGRLESAVRAPALPEHPAGSAFLEALAWFAAGAPDRAGSLTLGQLDAFLDNEVRSYLQLLRARMEQEAANDYARTRTWKVIQKLTLLRRQMSAPVGNGFYPYGAMSRAPGGDDPWESEHTLGSAEEFRQKVCRASHERPVLVKYGNTNCTQCMLFEIIGSVREFAEHPARRDQVDVYKVWWGLRPDVSFAGVIRDPSRLDELVEAEGVRSSPTFIVYRNGRRYPCGDAFPAHGTEATLDACLRQEFGEAPQSTVCSHASSLPGISGS